MSSRCKSLLKLVKLLVKTRTTANKSSVTEFERVFFKSMKMLIRGVWERMFEMFV